jgi:catechol 2,3-dioxygenase-like lactoylglutathione lyase family enzyme
MFASLDFLYVPAPDLEVSLRYYTEVLGAKLIWKIHKFGAWVACVRLTEGAPLVLLADHLEVTSPLLIYRVEDLDRTVAELEAKGWKAESGPFGIPQGPCYTFRDPAGVRLALYENQRPEAFEGVEGVHDAEPDVP